MDADLRVAASEPRTPSFARFLGSVLEENHSWTNFSHSAALAFKVDNKVLATVWGHGGRSLIDQERIKEDFGLKVALNSIDPRLVRSTDAKTIDDTAMQTRSQSSRLTRFDEFDFDAGRAILESVTGRPAEPSTGSLMTGRAQLTLHAPVSPMTLPAKGKMLLDKYRSRRYKKDFPWLDSLHSVNDTGQVNHLDETLIDQFSNGDFTNIHMAPPEVISWHDLHGFRYPGMNDEQPDLPDLDIRECLEFLPQRGEVSLNMLKTKKVLVHWSNSAQATEEWPAYKCLVAEISVGGRSYVLSNGKWFQVDQTLDESITRELSAIRTTKKDLFPEAEGDHDEERYNQFAANHLGWANMDRNMVRPSNAQSEIEICDLLSPEAHFAHIKFRNFSSTLSHLFSQGHVAARTILNDTVATEQFRAKLLAKNSAVARELDWDAIANGDMTIIYGIIAPAGKEAPHNLPFFSKVNLTHAARILRPMRCRFEIAAIPGQPKTQSKRSNKKKRP